MINLMHFNRKHVTIAKPSCCKIQGPIRLYDGYTMVVWRRVAFGDHRIAFVLPSAVEIIPRDHEGHTMRTRRIHDGNTMGPM